MLTYAEATPSPSALLVSSPTWHPGWPTYLRCSELVQPVRPGNSQQFGDSGYCLVATPGTPRTWPALPSVERRPVIASLMDSLGGVLRQWTLPLGSLRWKGTPPWAPTSQVLHLTFDHLLQMFPEDITHKVRRQLQEALLAEVAQHLAVHAKTLQVHVHQAELVGSPEQPLAHLLLVPQPGVCAGNVGEDTASEHLEDQEGVWPSTIHQAQAAPNQEMNKTRPCCDTGMF